MRLDVYIHNVNDSPNDAKLDLILTRTGIIMAAVDDLKAELVAANEATNEIAADVDDLVSRLADGGLTAAEAQEVKTSLEALKTRLQGVASVHTPNSPVG